MRGTLHFALAEDLPWMLDLTAKRVLAGAASRRAQLGLDLPTIEHAYGPLRDGEQDLVLVDECSRRGAARRVRPARRRW